MISSMHSGVRRTPLVLSFRRSLLAMLAAGTLLAVLLTALMPWDGPAGHAVLLLPALFLVYTCTGLIAWQRRPSNRMGPLILAAGAAVYLGGLSNTEVPGLESIGAVCGTLVLAAAVHLLHAFPSGRLRGRASGATVLGSYVAALPLEAPRYLFDPTGPAPWLAVADSPQAVAAGAAAQRVVGIAVMLATAAVLARRAARATPAQRRVLLPVYAYGILAVLGIPLSAALPEDVLGPTARGVAQFAVLGGIPLAFALGMLLGGFARTGEVEELGTWLGAPGAGGSDVAAALSATLGDPSLRLSYWVPDRRAFVDTGGRPVDDGPDRPPAPGRGSVGIQVQGAAVGGISYDAGLIEDRELVATAARVVAIAVDRERLTAELRASHAALQASRERLVEAIDGERRRIAQDLHDGLQMRLVLLALEAQRLGGAPEATAETAARATQLRRDIDAAAADLRQLVHDVMPAALVERGLWAAVEDLADRMPLPTHLDLRPGAAALPRAVESTAYFVVAEALGNAVKHAAADSVSVRLAVDGAWLRIAVDDDGVGGAAPNGGAGLVGLADRVDVLGGWLALTSEPGRGTHVTVELPCA